MSESSALRRIAVCVDDAGWSEANDAVILGHLQRREVSAVSVLIEGPSAPDWRGHRLPDSASIGLHLSLTWSPAEGSRGLGALLLQSQLRRLSQADLQTRLLGQLQRFETLLGRPPEFVDGHQHVHAFPTIATTLLTVLERRYGDARPALRSIRSARWRGAKASVLNQLGGNALQALLHREAWPGNRDFAGVYPFDRRHTYGQRMRSWLRDLGDAGLIMCHPGVAELPEHGDARQQESRYLRSTEWLQDRRDAGVVLQPFNRHSFGVSTQNR